jgi:hypothetical protein
MTDQTREREQFVGELCRALTWLNPDQIHRLATKLMRAAHTHGKLMEKECNEPLTDYDRRSIERIEAAIKDLCSELGIGRVELGGDPRGYTVKVHLSTGAYNTWGGKESGYGVPQ